MVYGLIDREGALKVEVCSQPHGMDLSLSADGRVVLPESSVSEVEFMLDKATLERLDIRFGGLTSAYQRLDRSTMDHAAFGQSIEGRYYCLDADATATFSLRDDQLTVKIDDGHGYAEGPVTPLGPDVAGMGPLAMIYWCVISLERDGERITGFRLDGMRTRRLAFKRC